MYNAESPTPMSIYSSPSSESGDEESPEANVGYIQYTLWDVPAALFILTISLKLRSSHIVKYKTFSYVFMYICPFTASTLPRGAFSQFLDRGKDRKYISN